MIGRAYGVRADGVRMNYDPYTAEMMAKYGPPGETDNEGFNPYTDSVGPGIYGGVVKRGEDGSVILGQQYQGHNPNPGPIYAGGGYTPINRALRLGESAVSSLLDRFPDLVNDTSTGGASPLHMCGMSQDNQLVTALLIERGGAIEAVDTYGYRPLHRMASNNLHIGAEALLKAGADPRAPTIGRHGETPMAVARAAGAGDVIEVLQKYLS